MSTPTNKSDVKSQQNGSLELGEEEEKNEDVECVDTEKHENVKEQGRLEEEKQRQKKKYTRLCRLRRRRCARKDVRGEAESDLSEGFDSEEDEEDDEELEGNTDSTGGTMTEIPDNPPAVTKEAKKEHLRVETSWGSGSEEEEGGTAFDIETDSDMNSQESRSDLEDMEEAEKPENIEGQVSVHRDEERDGYQPKEKGSDTNGPLAHSDSSISSNLQAMSSQLFQAKRCFRLAPTFSNMLLRPQASSSSPNPNLAEDSAPPSQETPPPPPQVSPCDLNPGTANGTNENGNVLFSFLNDSQQRGGRPIPIILTSMSSFALQIWTLTQNAASTAVSQSAVRKHCWRN